MSYLTRARGLALSGGALGVLVLGALGALAASPALAASSTVSGTINVAGATAAMSDVKVAFLNADGNPLGTQPTVTFSGATTNSESFSAAEVPAGSYYVLFYDRTAGDDDAPTYYGGTTLASASLVLVNGSGAAVALNATTLPAGGTIAGTVTDTTAGKAVDGGTVVVGDDPVDAHYQPWLTSTTVQADGAYALSGLPAGSYLVTYEGNDSGKPAYPFSVTYGSSGLTQAVGGGSAVAVGLAKTTSVNFPVPEAGSISGSVASAAANTPLSGVEVEIFDSSGDAVTSVATGDGSYSVAGLLPGSYEVEAIPNQALGGLSGTQVPLAFQFFTGAATLASATPVSVTANAAHAGINFALAPGAKITGKVVNARGGAALPDQGVDLLDAAGRVLTSTLTNSGGRYTLAGIPTGTYYVEFGATSTLSLDGISLGGDYSAEFYGGKATLAGARAVKVSAGRTVSNVNGDLLPASSAALGPPTATRGSLTGLSNDRIALGVRVAPGAGESADLAQVRVTLPSGLSWNRAALKKDLSLNAKYSYTLSGATLTLAFRAGQRAFTLNVKAGGIGDSPALRAAAKLRRIASEKIKLTVVDTQGVHTAVAFTVKKPH
ncbi:MAG TPA: carboxypeptidase regulatory-like domain-containing protein [Solirubrobacteraceae bacterium]|nr:carboxypeptidase regulatory-like domain-containing protein [Solirubrobacteraceae bacterium]